MKKEQEIIEKLKLLEEGLKSNQQRLSELNQADYLPKEGHEIRNEIEHIRGQIHMIEWMFEKNKHSILDDEYKYLNLQ